MSSAVEAAVNTYVRLVSEADAEVRAQLLEQCFAADGRMVTPSREIRGRAALASMLTRFLSDPELGRIRVLSAIETHRTTFRYRAGAEFRDGKVLENFDAGEIDADG